MSRTIDIKRIAKWVAVGAAAIVIGFLCDGSTEVGHHAFLIGGGIVIGLGASKRTK